MVECFQNIIRHGEKYQVEKQANRKGFFMTRNEGCTFYITSVNYIESAKVEKLDQRLHKLNTTSADDLKNLYFEMMNNDGLSAKGGANIGLIEIARKSGQKLEFEFVPYNEKLTLFYLQIKISNIANNELVKSSISFQSAMKLHADISSEKIFVIHQGSFSQDSIKPILRMVENNMRNFIDELKIQKLAYHIMVEMLQNISRHALLINDEKKGIFLMGEADGQYFISTGNYILTEKSDIIKNNINQLNLCNKEELDAQYKQVLRKGKPTEGGGAGLGFIDIAREAKGKIEFSIHKISDQHSFLSLIIKL